MRVLRIRDLSRRMSIDTRMAAISQANSPIIVEERTMKEWADVFVLMNRNTPKSNTPKRAITSPLCSMNQADSCFLLYLTYPFTNKVETRVDSSRTSSSMNE